MSWARLQLARWSLWLQVELIKFFEPGRLIENIVISQLNYTQVKNYE